MTAATAAMRVVATAGHVDHGKSSLVRALTGTDPDRFAEEKERGLTIDLGFAFTTLPSGSAIGFVDVPGHVRFVKNMLAGVGSVRAVVLVIDPAEGWMPQTEEHLRILDLLGVEHGVVVLAKADLVDAETLEIAQIEAADRLEGSLLAGSPVVACDSLSGRGLDEVRNALDAMVGGLPAEPGEGRARLWIDRSFSARGAGTVVTGTLTGGPLALDDDVEVVPAGRPARVRGIQSGHQKTDVAQPGTRVALNLAGVERGEVARGDAVVVEGQWRRVTVVDVALTLLPGAQLRERAQLKVHVGSGEHDARVRRLGDRYARVVLPHPLPLAPGDRLILRDPGPDATVAGAEVLDLDPTGPVRGAEGRLGLPLGPRLLAGRPWLARAELPALAGVSEADAEELANELVASGEAVDLGAVVVATSMAGETAEAARAAVDRFHAEQPLEPGLDLQALAGRLGVDATALRVLLDREPGLTVAQGRVRRTDHVVDVVNDERAAALLAALEAAPFSPPTPAEVGTPPEVVRAMERAGTVADVGGIVMAASAVEEAERRIAEAVQERGTVTVGDVRDLLGSSRKYVLAILAHCDATGITRRRGDERIPGPRAPA